MLKELRVRNYAIIQDLAVSFHPGLNVLTGETGAGKSIVVGALGLALGQRAYTEMIKTGAESASVEAFFDISGHPALEALGIAGDEGIIVRRVVSSGGKSKAYVNDTMVSVQSLSDLGASLVDIHGQHEHQSLLHGDNQMRLLDYFGGLEAERQAVAALFSEAQALERRISDLRQDARERAQRLDLLRFQAAEIEGAAPEPGEDARLENERSILANLQRLNELLEEAYSLLYSGEGSTVEKLSAAVARLREMSTMDSSVAEPLAALDSALPVVEDACISLRGLRESYDLDPARLEGIEERLDLLKALKKKYGDSIEEVLAYGERARAETKDLERSEEVSGGLEAELAEKRRELELAAAALSRGRREAARGLAARVKEELRGLALEKAEFSASVEAAPVSSSGADSVEFLFSANAGEALKPLAKVASGGELSRIMLAIKSVLRGSGDVPVLIFDEVDAGIGGRTALNVARKLKELSVGSQVICITHLPQIAAAADRHLVVEKSSAAGGVSVAVREVTGGEREVEVARMLHGKVTEASLRHAREIIGGPGLSKKRA
ncbi:MAG: DNA repair protein RecN [Thermodesulfovibrionales bacterium]